MAAIEIKGLCYRYTEAEAVLDGVDLTLADGEAHAVLGGSGAGKTTLLNLLAGLLQPQSGTIFFNGQDVTRLGGAGRNVAQVFQFPVLYPSLNVADNIGFALGNRGWQKEAVRKRILEVAELLEIAPLLGKRPGSLSLFEKQLVAIARALARPDVAVVLLDEPLTAVQPATKWRLRRALKTVQQESGLTMVYVTHDQAEALTFADRITMLHQGAALQTGTPSELYEAPAHTAVAGFIGSPGMNLVEADVQGGRLRIGKRVIASTRIEDGRCIVGFRPEWAKVEPGIATNGEAMPGETNAGAAVPGEATSGEVIPGEAIPVIVEAVRVLGTEEGVPLGLVTARLDGTPVNVRQRLDRLPAGDPAGPAPARGNGLDIPDGSHRAQTAYLRLDAGRLVTYRNDRLVAHAD